MSTTKPFISSCYYWDQNIYSSKLRLHLWLLWMCSTKVAQKTFVTQWVCMYTHYHLHSLCVATTYFWTLWNYIYAMHLANILEPSVYYSWINLEEKASPQNIKAAHNACFHNTFSSITTYNLSTAKMCLTHSLDIMCSESDWFEVLSLLVQLTVVSLREAVARKLREETKQFWFLL